MCRQPWQIMDRRCRSAVILSLLNEYLIHCTAFAQPRPIAREFSEVFIRQHYTWVQVKRLQSCCTDACAPTHTHTHTIVKSLAKKRLKGTFHSGAQRPRTLCNPPPFSHDFFQPPPLDCACTEHADNRKPKNPQTLTLASQTLKKRLPSCISS